MTVYVYPGYSPSNVAKDAKYSVKREDGGWIVHLTYHLDRSTRELLTTDAHPKLVAMVNRVKREITGQEGGAFYINEHCHVLVPDPQGALFAGEYAKELRFDFEGGTLGPRPPAGLQPGDEWKGPHVGIKYTLAATNDDIYYDHDGGKLFGHQVNNGTSAIARVHSMVCFVYISSQSRIFAHCLLYRDIILL